MQKRLAKDILESPIRLSEIKPGDRVRGFEAWGCVPDNATRTVMQDESGLYVECKSGHHYLDGQTSEDGTLLGMMKIPRRSADMFAP
jgi:hypothetical protein